MGTLYLVTGAAGHLGNVVVRRLLRQGAGVRALVLPGDPLGGRLPQAAQLCSGDVLDRRSLEPFFEAPPGRELVVIHCAGIVSIASRFQQRVYDVNVEGTRNVVELCMKNAVKKLVYVSSVHAIPELPDGQVIREVEQLDPQKVVGLYAKTKAEATGLVLAAAARGLHACVAHPSGICGPYDYGAGHLTQLFLDYCRGKLTAGVAGGYDFVDVRDVAEGVMACCEKGRDGQCYILSNRYFSIPQVLEIFHTVTGFKRIRTFLPMWFAKMTAPLSEQYYKLKKQTPLYTAYSLYTLTSNARFSHEKADQELGYTVRPLVETVADMASWLAREKRI